MSYEDDNTLGGRDEQQSTLEAIEQQLIQQMRTAGIRKPREIELIDQVMTLRRERRKSFHALNVTVRRFAAENQDLRTQLSNCRKDSEYELATEKSLHSKTLEKRELEIQGIRQHYDSKYLKEKERNYNLMKDQIEKISHAYEVKLKIVDQKIQELSAARDGHDQRTAERIAYDMTTNAISEQNDRQKEKIQKYKETLRCISEREREAIEELHISQSKLLHSEQEKKSVLSRVQQAAEQFSNLKEKEKEMQRVISSLQNSSETSSAMVKKLQSELIDQKKNYDTALSVIEKDHNSELIVIDNKVRKTLQIRDETIKSLRENISQAAKRQSETEKVLSDLNAGFSSKQSSRSGW